MCDAAGDFQSAREEGGKRCEGERDRKGKGKGRGEVKGVECR